MQDAQTVSPTPTSTAHPGARRVPLLAARDVVVPLLLALLMLAGGMLRFTGLNWDDYTYLHPDERFLNDVASMLGGGHWMVYAQAAELTQAQRDLVARCLSRYPETNGAGGYFDADCSTLNPHNANARFGTFVYGTLPLFTARGAAVLLTDLTNDPGWTSFYQIHLVWRAVSAISETLTILVVFCIGLRAHGRWVGLLAAALYAFTTFSIQQSHFGTADAMANLFTALSVLFAVCVQKTGKLRDYVLFGVFFGCALASRVNLAPLVGLVIVAAALRALPAFARGFERGERDAVLSQVGFGLVMAALATFVTFRLLNPYAFTGPSVFGIVPNARWVDDIGRARYFVSGEWDAPPNWQWVARPRYLFALWNMVAWGMGLAFGITAWVAALAALWRIVRGKPGALANVVLVAWVVAYFAFMGNQWVMTMRYYLPLYPVLAVLAAWGLASLVRGPAARISGRMAAFERLQTMSEAPAEVSRAGGLRRAVGWVLIVGVVGFTALWGLMFTDVYRNLSNRVAASVWFWEQVPGDFAMRIEDAPEGTPLINIALNNGGFPGSNYNLAAQATQLNSFTPLQTYNFIAPASGLVTQIHAPHLGDLNDNPAPETLRFIVYRARDNERMATALLTANFTRANHPLGDSYDITFDESFTVTEGEEYRFEVALVEGEAVVSGGSVAVWEGDWDDPLPVKTCTPTDGLTLADNPPPGRFSANECNGRDAYWALLTGGHKLQMVNNDSVANRERMLTLLDDTDYIIISSNRFYDSMTRNPARWPMTTRYYEALFSGELGFERAAVFNRAFGLGPLQIPDNHLPFFDAPAWLNELEAEEAFHVYDHPAVIIFRKSETYTPENARAILESVPMTPSTAASPINICPGGDVTSPACRCPDNPDAYYCDPTLIDLDTVESLPYSRTPTYLMMTDEQRNVQDAGGTWSARFDSDALINSQPVLTVVFWWLAMIGFGWAAFPLVFRAFPALADRGYALSKIIGLLLVAWATWYVASLRVPVWNAGGILAALILLAALSLLLVWPRRVEFVRFVRGHLRMLLAIEAITLVCFLAFLGVRLTNPDLWHFAFGGEKPMDFAYFNGVLRSSVFPPLDPWFAGGYINYYYFGFVIVGAPTLLLGVLPQVAYNLIIPTLFALTGIGAFAVAFSIVSAHGLWRRPNAADAPEAEAAEGAAAGFQYGDRPLRSASPWIAGIAALILAVVLGNLDTPRTFLNGVANAGGYEAPPAMIDFLFSEAQASGAMIDYADLERRAENPSLVDHLRYELSNTGTLVNSIGQGFSNLFAGQPLPLAPHRWYWGPTRILGETQSGNAIVEMPFFTFLYGDLHAHMIAMPLQFIVMAFVLNEVLTMRGAGRPRTSTVLALALGGIAVGALFATNSWDWITYLILGVVGLGYVWWLNWQKITRWSLLALVGTLGGFFLIQHFASLPFTTWFANAYTGVQWWTDDKTPLWAFFSIHGVFLFLLVSLLVWDTGRWFRSVRVAALRGTLPFAIAGIVLLATILLGVVIATLTGYQAALIVVPLILWIAALFLRDGQSRAMRTALAFAGLALALTLGVEVFVLTGDIGRQNTIFKFYMQVWLLFSVVGGAAFAWLWASAPRWSGGLRNAWYTVAAVLLFVAALYPVMATRGRALDRFDTQIPLTLDGMAYMNSAIYGENNQYLRLAGDYQMIRWLQENVAGTPVIMEGQSEPNLYKWGSRISINTGLPSVIGWDWHQTQQRALHNMPAFVRQRGSNVNAFYSTTDIPTAERIMRFYNVEYIIVGDLERAYYPPAALEKFERMESMGMLEAVYRDGENVIYQVLDSAPAVAEAAPLEAGS